MRIEAVDALASSVHASPGATALLLGSGVSRAAGIPTGWEVVDELIRRVAVLRGETEPDDPEAWWSADGGGAPSYSALLAELAPTSAARRNLLEPFFKPTADERERGEKRPTRAHRAIARLVADGYVRVIVTTNFDRLLEAALVDAGVQPIVISTPAAATGATPLVHNPCTVIKLHGDYLEPDLRNTVAELDHYDPVFDQLIDRVLDEYGLIVCGWSADWDSALRAAMQRCPTRRYPTWWATRGDLTAYAADLAALREASMVQIGDADSFIDAVADKVAALADLTDRRPRSTALAVAELKRHLPNPVARIRLHDLLIDHTDPVVADLPTMTADRPNVSADAVLAAMGEIETATATLRALLVNLAFFADNADHDQLIADIVRRLARTHRRLSGYGVYVNLQRYPAMLAIYAVTLGAVARRRLDPLAGVMQITVSDNGMVRPLLVDSASWNVLSPEVCSAQFDQHHFTPVSDHLHEVFRPTTVTVVTDDDFDDLFDDTEYLLGELGAYQQQQGRAPVGRFVWRGRFDEGARRTAAFEVIRGQVEQLVGDRGLFDDTDSRYNDLVTQAANQWW